MPHTGTWWEEVKAPECQGEPHSHNPPFALELSVLISFYNVHAFTKMYLEVTAIIVTNMQ